MSTNLKRKDVSRRAALSLLGAVGAAGAVMVVGCGGTDTNGSGGGGGGGAGGGSSSSNGSSSSSGGATDCETIPEETAGPYPDKTGMLDDPAFYRQDVTEGKEGLPLTVEILVVDVNAACAAVSGAVVEIWHCDADGNYSEYTQPGYDGTGETFLRGLQTAGADGKVTFTTIYPGWYMGRATHIHLDVYVNKNVVKTSQMAFPETITTEVYSQVSPYSAKGQNPITNATDNVFSDGTSLQMASLSGDTTTGYKATLTVGVAL